METTQAEKQPTINKKRETMDLIDGSNQCDPQSKEVVKD